MMSHSKKSDTCDRIAEIVPYLYGESSVADSAEFETHLLDCEPCTDEFAAIAEARFAVYEWNREEFLSIPTPAFVIPYEKQVEKTVILGNGFSKIFGLPQLSFWGQAAAAFGTIALLVGIGAFVLSGSGEHEIASNSNAALRPNAAIPSAIASAPESRADVDSGTKAIPARSPRVSVVKASSGSRAASNPSRGSLDRASSVQAKNGLRRSPLVAPTLSGNDDEVDDSLRLSDLFAEVDSLE